MKLFVELEENKIGRDFVVGDIHGMMHLLQKKMEENNFDKTKDRLISVGDLIDRGPDSLSVLRLILEPWFFSVRGNHEDMMIGRLNGLRYAIYPDCADLWEINGGNWVNNENLEEVTSLSTYHYKNVPLALSVIVNDKPVFVSHAMPLKDWDIKFIKSNMIDLIWDRSVINKFKREMKLNFWKNDFESFEYSIHGHTPTHQIIDGDGKVKWIDTGAFATNNLTFVEIKKLFS